jgi:O-Antigen ligase
MAHEARSDRARLSPKARRPAVAAARPSTRSLAGVFLALPPVALVAVALLLAFRGGGSVVEEWAPVAVGTAVALAALAAVGSLPAIPRNAWPALSALAAYVGWSAVSLTWSASPERTVEAVARLTLLLVAALVGASYAARPGAARALAIALAAAGAGTVLAVEVKVLSGSTGAFTGTRLAWPIDYANGEAALLWLPLPALLAGAAAERIPPLGRAFAAAAAALALATGLMTLSRGAAIALVATLVVCIAFAVERSRLALTIAAIALPVASLGTRLTAGTPGEVAADAASRGRAAALSALVAALLVLALASLERFRSSAFGRAKAPAAIAVWAAVLTVGAGLFLVHYGRPDNWLTARWHEFRDPQLGLPEDASRFGTATSARYDYWRVALRTFAAHPLSGEGAGAFAVPWFQHRSIDLNVTDPHSWEAAALAETGVIGFVLLGASLLIPLRRSVRARESVGDFVSVALIGSGAYFALHASLDWLLLIPAVAVPSFVVVGACSATGASPAVHFARAPQRSAAVVGALAAIALAVPVYLSTALTARAEDQAATSAAEALRNLSFAASLNPWALQPLIIRSVVLQSNGEYERAVAAAEEATRRGPRDWTAWAALAGARNRAGDTRGARVANRRAAALNPRGHSPPGVAAAAHRRRNPLE